jgi:hypothetical protein
MNMSAYIFTLKSSCLPLRNLAFVFVLLYAGYREQIEKTFQVRSVLSLSKFQTNTLSDLTLAVHQCNPSLRPLLPILKMPFPSDPLVLHGGCNCTAVRWRMSLRAANPYHTPGTDIGDVRLPTAVVCHCDGCRQATGSLGAYGFTSDMALLELSILPRASMPDREKSKDDETRPPFVPAASLMDEPTAAGLDDLWLMHYESSPKRDRWFCGRCGTQMAIAASKDTIPAEWGWPRVVNIWAGTTDRNLLENDWCRPDHIMDCSIAIP